MTSLKKISIIILLIFILLTIVAIVNVFSQARWRIMPMGNSITELAPGYRGPLYDSLIKAGFKIDFVGDRNSGGMKDSDHAGHGGFTIGPGYSLMDDYTSGKGNLYVITDMLMANNPHIILLEIGVNDFFNINDNKKTRQPGYKTDLDGPKRLAGLIEKISMLNPRSLILATNILAVEWDANFAKQYNDSIPTTIQRLKNKGINVEFIDMRNECHLVKGDWSDGLHPTSAGGVKMASVWLKYLLPHLNDSLPLLSYFTYAQTKNLTVFFSSVNAGGTIKSRNWNFGDGEQGDGTSVSHTYNIPGKYKVTITLTDSTNKIDSFTQSVIVKPEISDPKILVTIASEPGSNNYNGFESTYAFDDNVNTYYDAAKADNAYILEKVYGPKEAKLTSVLLCPRLGAANLMEGSKIVASKTPDFLNSKTLYTFIAAPADSEYTQIPITDTMYYRYFKYIAPNNSHCNIAELSLYGIMRDTSVISRISNVELTHYEVYPNPANEKFIVQNNENANPVQNISLYNYQGVCILNKFLKSAISEIETTNLKNGIYFVQISGSYGSNVCKLVISH